MFNNDVTYDKKWETPENLAALKELERKYFDHSSSSPHCPAAWAPEVLELMNLLNDKLRFKYNESTIRGYYIQGSPLTWFILNPWSNAAYCFKRHFIDKEKKTKRLPELKREPYTFWGSIKDILSEFAKPISYGFKALTVRYLNPLRNKLYKPQISLGQVKEKYGELRIYFNVDSIYDDWVDKQIRITQIKLAMKGAYYPVAHLWGATTSFYAGTEYNPDTFTTKVITSSSSKEKFISVEKTVYRQLMKDMGLDLPFIQAQYDLYVKDKSGKP